MALNNDLNGVLNNMVYNVSPVIKLSNGLYTLVDKSTIISDETPGTNLIGFIVSNCSSTDEIIYKFKLLGNWSSNNYSYNNDTNKWEETISK